MLSMKKFNFLFIFGLFLLPFLVRAEHMSTMVEHCFSSVYTPQYFTASGYPTDGFTLTENTDATTNNDCLSYPFANDPLFMVSNGILLISHPTQSMVSSLCNINFQCAPGDITGIPSEVSDFTIASNPLTDGMYYIEYSFPSEPTGGLGSQFKYIFVKDGTFYLDLPQNNNIDWDNFSIAFLPLFVIIFILVMMFILQIIGLKNPWKEN